MACQYLAGRIAQVQPDRRISARETAVEGEESNELSCMTVELHVGILPGNVDWNCDRFAVDFNSSFHILKGSKTDAEIYLVDIRLELYQDGMDTGLIEASVRPLISSSYPGPSIDHTPVRSDHCQSIDCPLRRDLLNLDSYPLPEITFELNSNLLS